MSVQSIPLAPWSVRRPASATLTPRGRAIARAAVGFAAVLVAVAAFLVPALAAPEGAGAVDDGASLVGAAGAELAARGLAESYVVLRGDTLWDLAAQAAPGSDPRAVVDEIRRMNGLTGSELAVGQRLWLPRAQRAAA